MLTKNNRHINKTSLNKKEYALYERIHSDLCGPFIETYNKYKYFITFMDRKSRYLKVELLKNKSDAFNAFEKYNNKINNNNKRIKEFFSDEGTEYINKSFKSLFNQKGIIHKTSPPYTKESNGFIERINLTLLNKVRALQINAGLTKYLWGEALITAAYLYNITPHSALNKVSADNGSIKTPYLLFHGTTPDYNLLKAWGSIVYYNDNKTKGKLHPRTEKGILIGYGNNNKIYRVWNKANRTLIWVWDVNILEFSYDKVIDPDIHNLNELYLNYNPTTEPHINFKIKTNNNIIVEIPQKNKEYYNRFKILAEDESKALLTIKDTILYSKLNNTVFSQSLADFILAATILNEPNNYKEAQRRPDFELLHKACLDENNEL